MAETPSGAKTANAAVTERRIPWPASGHAAGRDAVTREVCRGVGRLLRALGFAVINELSLANGRRADVVGLSPPATSGSSR